MKICFITNLYPPNVLGGAEIIVEKMALNMLEHGHESIIITTSPDDEEHVLNRDNTVIFGDYRVTVLADRLFRIEKDRKKSFCDSATQAVWFRNMPVVKYSVEAGVRSVNICTNRATLTVKENVMNSTVTVDGKEIEYAHDTPVSMNLWGFTEDFVKEAHGRLADFLDRELESNPMKCEYFIPTLVADLINENKAEVKVIENEDKWFGVTYKEDKPLVVEAIGEMITEGLYE